MRLRKIYMKQDTEQFSSIYIINNWNVPILDTVHCKYDVDPNAIFLVANEGLTISETKHFYPIINNLFKYQV